LRIPPSEAKAEPESGFAKELLMELDNIKTEIKNLSPAERRKLAVYILELEKEDVREKYGPQIERELDKASKAFQEAFEKLKTFVNKS
jgi:hypothetical protein